MDRLDEHLNAAEKAIEDSEPTKAGGQSDYLIRKAQAHASLACAIAIMEATNQVLSKG